MPRPSFTILLATVDRTDEVCNFLRSLERQTYRDFELLLVDQNTDDRLSQVLEPYRTQFPIRQVRCERGHSRAFNLGLTYATGDVVAFPDDDCWYDPDLLERVARRLAFHPEVAGVTGREVVEPGFTCGGRWDMRPGLITRKNVFRRAISFTVFLRRGVAARYSFDETLGVGAGTPWGAGEETDYLLNLIEQRHAVWFDPSIAIWHQGRSGPFTPQTFAKARSYGMGMGRVLRKNGFSHLTVARHVLRPAAGALLSLAAGKMSKARYHWSICAGRIAGWRLTPQRWVAPQSTAVTPRRPASQSLISTGGERLP